MGGGASTEMINDPAKALPGRSKPMGGLSDTHYVLRENRVKPPFPEGCETMAFGMGCFWGAERAYWKIPGVYSTAVGYQGGHTPNPTYEEVCTGKTSHNEVVMVVFNPKEVPYSTLLKLFWESHDSTQYMQQGNDVGTQYRSAIYTSNDKQQKIAQASKETYQRELSQRGVKDPIVSEILKNPSEFYYAELEHQQYLAKNPGGYCNLQGVGVSCPIDFESKL